MYMSVAPIVLSPAATTTLWTPQRRVWRCTSPTSPTKSHSFNHFAAFRRRCPVPKSSYYSALDAPKTGVEVHIPHQLKLCLQGTLPPWHSRKVKAEAWAASVGRSSSSSRPPVDAFKRCRSQVCRYVCTQRRNSARGVVGGGQGMGE
jgi:hypothetical protein